MSTITREPVAIISVISGAIIAVLQAVGADFLPEGVAVEVINIIQAIVVIAGILLARSQVTPVADPNLPE